MRVRGGASESERRGWTGEGNVTNPKPYRF